VDVDDDLSEEGFREVEVCVSEYFGAEMFRRRRTASVVSKCHIALVALLPFALIIGLSNQLLKDTWTVAGGTIVSLINGTASLYVWKAKAFAISWEVSSSFLEKARTAWPSEHRRFVVQAFKQVLRRPLEFKELKDGS
jgi:hypothetical protein